MTTEILLDCEMTSLLQPQLLSMGLVTLDGRECYAELDLESALGQARLAETGWDVRDGVIKDKWGLFPESVCDSERTMGQRVGDWLLGIADSGADRRICLMFDYWTDYELLVGALEECELWSKLQSVVSPRNIANETGIGDPVFAKEATFRALRLRATPLSRHHALADALALRAAWNTWYLIFERSWDFLPMLRSVGYERDAWLSEWLASPAPALGGLIPLDVLAQQGGAQRVADALDRTEGGAA